MRPERPARPARILPVLAVAGALVLIAVSCSDDGSAGPSADPSSTVPAAAAASSTAAPAASTAPSVSAGYDLTRLVVGDDQHASAPTVGRIFTCGSNFGGGGASRQGPWFNGDGTWDATKKIAVAGAVTWDAASVRISLQGDRRVITANALPSHATGVFPIAADDPAYSYDRNPNSIASQTITASVPATPTPAETPSCIRGEVGIATDGVPIFDGFDAGGRDAVAWEVQDACHGHPQQSGVYHYHDVSPCLGDGDTAQHSALVGYAWDGFGIFGPRGEGGAPLRNEDLDECHGHTHTVDWDGKQVETYHYHATSQFPYTVGCFRGTSAQGEPSGGAPGGAPPDSNGGPPPGPPGGPAPGRP